MFGLTLAQMRRSLGRLTAAGIAIVIGTAFVAATLLAGEVLKRSSYDSVAASFADAALIVRPTSDPDAAGYGSPLTQGDLTTIRLTDGVRAADPVASTYVVLGQGGKSVYQTVIGVGSDPSLQPLAVTEGALPSSPDEIALPADVVARLGTTVGGTVTQTVTVVVPGAGSEDEWEWEETKVTLVVTGLVDDPNGAFSMTGGAGLLTDDAIQTRISFDFGGDVQFREATVALEDGADVESVRADLESTIGQLGFTVLTKDEAAAASVTALTNDEDVFTMTILAFAAIALLVAALVIANTFQVIVAQRTRTLALLRCVGASKRQLRSSVLLEASLLGVIASAIGFALGALLVQITVLALQRVDLDIPIPRSITITVASVVWPLAVGTLVTVLASLVPARAATRVAPLAALRPAELDGLSKSSSKVRLIFSLLLVVGGGALMAIGLGLSASSSVEFGLMTAMLGGAASFVGVLLGAVFWVPKIVAGIARLLSRFGASAQLAAANTVRNPRRTAATSTALLIGVTLVAMMSVGAATARNSLATTLDEQYPFDVAIDAGVISSAPDDGTDPATGLTPALIEDLSKVSGVAAMAQLSGTNVTVTWPDDSTSQDVVVNAVDPAAAAAAVNPDGLFDGLDDQTVVVGLFVASAYHLDSGSTLQLAGVDGTVTVNVVVANIGSDNIIATPAVGRELDGAAVVNGVWLKITDPSDASAIVADIRDTMSQTPAALTGAAMERAAMQQVIDTILAVIIGLLGIAVVIALIGVANTLSLSVLERRRESATLRAIGLSRRQLRTTLAIEGTLIAGVGAVLGVLLGLVYGWIGSTVVLGSFAGVRLTVPWRDLVLVVAIAIAAGLLASVLPARSAARTSPVEALAVE
ncbi:putative ABC transport system permease protein [Sanguibacter gelidistatuariae]|uniref:Putative ABC transport system permease protein n=1 Tax=Sanguibacter gelidistatuariae TaxID=1814289 RepID=A0A1G6QLP0_9MICO|nr:FtsX-like permease family protein [Sanguibacter gelidistatuariae]SDC93322.1 putative ABC transport system permease protein [Sanguibacter gelidistatuariae]